MTPKPDSATVAAVNRKRVISTLGSADALFIATSPANVTYCSGYRSMGYDTDLTQQMAVVFDENDWILVGPTADLWSAQECSGPALRYIGYRRFFFDHADALEKTGTRFTAFDTFDQALSAAVRELSAGKRHVALDGSRRTEALRNLAPIEAARVDAMFRTARARKHDLEINLLRSATQATEHALSQALADAHAGMTELDLSAAISSEMIKSGLRPGFVVVSSGPRAAFADTYASGRRLDAGDLVRIDVGGTLEGYWSDTATTAIVGEPTAEITGVNAAIIAGQEAGLELVAPGVMTDAIFHRTVDAVRQAGLTAYQRHHVGHGLGLESHEFPTIGPNNPVLLEPGMVINIETPYYRPGWGGLMYEDTMLITETGVEHFTQFDSEIVKLPA